VDLEAIACVHSLQYSEANCLLPARRIYTKRRICDRAVSVCPSDAGIVLKRLKQNVVHTFEGEHPLRTRRIGVWSLNLANSNLGSAIFPKRHEIEP